MSLQAPADAGATEQAPAVPDLTIIVVTHNGRDMALQTLRSAREAAEGLDVQWLVVDAGSTDGVADAVERSAGDIAVMRHSNVGFAAANNVGLREARGRYVLLLNPDVEIVTGSFRDLVEIFDARPEVGLASVVQRDGDGVLQATIRHFPAPALTIGEAVLASKLPGLGRLREEEIRSEEYERDRHADWLVGAFLIARREAIRDVGPLDERFFLYAEETDWCHRFHLAGWQVRHLPGMTITHYGGGYDSPTRMAQLTYARLQLSRKYYGRAGRAAMRGGFVVRHALRAAAFGLLVPLRPALRNRVRAESAALAVALGLRGSPYAPAAEPA